MKVDDYRLLLTIKQIGTIRGAAKELLISQPAISQRLKQIEENWGDKIFVRTHKRVIVTPVGEKIIAFGEKVVKGEEKLLDSLANMSTTISGRLSLGVSSVVAQYLLPNILKTYIEKFPNVKMELFTGLSHEITTAVENFHVSIVRGNQINGLNCTELFTDKLYLIRKSTLKRNNLLIEFQSDQSFHTAVNEWFLDHPEFKPSGKIKVDQIETCKQLMSHGIGMAVLPEIAIKDYFDMEDYTLQPLITNNKHISRPTWLCYSEAAMELPQVKAFLDISKECMR
ncbi:LysR family transcriptional regulator [Evansella sp. AB-P1]|uniref:LysR family transcriptional regulator n=1 Tax=Evansella sp. AB-P1 TaxID=3037653 RepID=UPI00241C2845|nr:LysR family transcriptional regulator [Evansella sp. AB-P1]MDG5785993.1 LysR family transcriptional regulator [Evansella sp. AB-P1]